MPNVLAAPVVRERPILFSGPMVRAIREDRKTQTRRVMVNQPYSNTIKFDNTGEIVCHNDYLPPSATLLDVGRGRNRYTTSLEEEGGSFAHLCPYGAVGDRLYVRERWRIAHINYAQPSIAFYDVQFQDFAVRDCPIGDSTEQAALFWLAVNDRFENGETGIRFGKWRPSIHMHRWASRITLEITGVRVELVQDVSEEDAKAEGAEPDTSELAGHTPYKSGFAHLWQQKNGKRGFGWDRNPWVWVVEFRRIDA